MADVCIDISDESGSLEVRNPELFFIHIEGCGLTLQLAWEQAEQLHRQLKGLFDA